MREITQKDLLDALDHMSDFVAEVPVLSDFDILGPRMFQITELENFDDLSAWQEWDEDELRESTPEERREDIEHFRGADWAARASTWKRPEEVPPIVVIDSPEFVGIADGRGRVSYAIGMGWKSVPGVLLEKRAKPEEL